MDEIFNHLRESIEDHTLTKSERRTLKSLLSDVQLDQQQLSVLRSKIYELASEKVTAENYRHVIEWLRHVSGALIAQPDDSSDAFFSPGEACRNVIIRQIDSARSDLKICVFTISDDWISEAIRRSHSRGVSIQIITDDDKSADEGSDISDLVRAGIPIKIDNSPNHMHHKFMIADERVLLTGSYNWTLSAARFNHENILMTREVGVVRSFLKEFGQLWKKMELY